MTTLSVHANEMPTFEFVNHGSFQVLRINVTNAYGEKVLLTVHLPEGSSHDDIVQSVADATVQDTRSKQEAMI